MAKTVGNLIANLRMNVASLEADVGKAQRSLHKLGRTASNLGSDLTRTVSLPIAAVGGAAIKFGADFEEAFAGVRKTVTASEADFKMLETGIREMAQELPASAVEIANVAEAAGQLGVETPNILKFTRVMIDLGETTNLSSTEAATALARFMNVMGTAQTDVDRLGATIVDLGNNFATTEREVVEMGLRIAGAGKQIGLTEAEVLGFATALSSVGVEAEAGGTAISRVMVEIEKSVATGSENLEMFAAVAGQSVAEFRRSFQEDAAGTIANFIERLGQIQESGTSVSVILEAMGLDAIRVADVLKRTANSGDLLTRALNTGSKAWHENTALVEEAEKRYATFWSQAKILFSGLAEAGIELFNALRPVLVETVIPAAKSLVGVIADIAKAFNTLPGPVKTATVVLLGLAAAAGPIISQFGSLAFAVKNLLPLLPALTKATGLLGSAYFAIPAAIGGAILAFRSLSADIHATWTNTRTLHEQYQNSMSIWTVLKTAILGPVGALMRLIDAIGMAKNFFVIWQEQGIRAAVASLQGLNEETKKAAETTGMIYGPTLEQAGKTTADLGNAAGDAGPPVFDLGKFLEGTGNQADEAAQKIKQVQEAFESQLNPAAALEAQLGILLERYSKDQVVKVWSDRIIEAAEASQENGQALGEHTKALYEDAKALSRDEKITKLLETAKKNLRNQLKETDFGFKDHLQTAEALTGQYQAYSETTWEVIGRVVNMREATADTTRTVRELTAAGYSAEQITKLFGREILAAKEAADLLGIQLDETTLELIRHMEATKENSKAAAEWRQVWIEAMGRIYSDFIDWTANMISRGNTFAKQLLKIFLSNLLNPLWNAASVVMGNIADGIFGLFKGEGFGGFKNIFSGVKEALGIGGGAAAAAAAAGGTAAAAGGTAAAAGGAGAAGAAGAAGPASVGLGGSLAAFFTNPWTIGIGAALGGGLLLKKLLGSSVEEKGSKEVARDFGVRVGESTVKGFISAINLPKKTFEDLRKDVLSSPKFFQDVLLPAAQATGQVDQLISRFSRLEAFGQTHDFGAAAAQAAQGNFDLLNKQWADLFASGGRLNNLIPNWQTGLLGVSQSTEETATAAADAGEQMEELGRSGSRAVDSLTTSMTKMKDTLIAGFEDLLSRLDAIVEKVGADLEGLSDKLGALDAKIAASSQRAQDLARTRVEMGGVSIRVDGSRSDSREVADRVMREFEREMDTDRRGLRSKIARTVTRTNRAY